MKVLVTGSAGFIGSFVARKLIARGDDVIGIDNFSDYYSRRAKEFNVDLTRAWSCKSDVNQPDKEFDKVYDKLCEYYGHESKDSYGTYSFFEMDVRNREEISKLFDEYKFDAVIHLAGMAGVELSVSEPLLYADVNIMGSLYLLEAAKANQVKKFIFASSSSVYGDTNEVPYNEADNVDNPLSPYAATKRMMEIMNYTYNHLYNLSIVNVRIFGPIYGPLQRPFRMVSQRFINYAYHDKPMTVYGNGREGGRDTTYIDDEVDGIIKVLDSPIQFETINIGSGKVVSPLDVARVVKEILGKGEIEFLPRHKSEMSISSASMDKAEALLNYYAKWSFEEGMRRQVEIFLLMPDWYKNLPC